MRLSAAECAFCACWKTHLLAWRGPFNSSALVSDLKLEATEFERYDHVALVVFGSEIKVVSYYTREYTQIQEYCCKLHFKPQWEYYKN